MIFILYIIIIIYSLAIGWLIYGISKVENAKSISLLEENISNKTSFTIIVPFRNEAENLPKLLESISKLNYSTDLFEVILVDDFSDEKFQVSGFRFQVSVLDNIRTSNSPKKDAITTAVQHLKTDWIITTDADCIVNENWLATLDYYIRNNVVSMIAAGVTYDCKNNFLHHFQQLDLASLQGATIGSFGIGKGFMCNGANFAYTKKIFEELNGFEGNDKIPSGDDVFLLQKGMSQFPNEIHFLKSDDAIVTTKPVDDWKSLFYQRVRWASKTSSYQSKFGIALGLVVFAGNLSLVILFGLILFGSISLQQILPLLLLKFLIDSILITKAHHSITANKMHYLFLGSFLYPLFSVSVAFYSLFGKYEWKGRTFSK